MRFNTFILCTTLAIAMLAGCTTTSISSHAVEKIENPYDNIVVAFMAGGDFHRKKIIEDRVVAMMQVEGIRAIPSYKIIPPQANQEKIFDAMLSAGADAVLLIQRGTEKEASHVLQGTQTSTAMDNRGNQYTYQAPTTESYSSIARGFQSTLVDIKKNKVVWIAGSKTNTLAPAELRMFSDFHDSAVNSYVNALLDEMKSSGLVGRSKSTTNQLQRKSPVGDTQR